MYLAALINRRSAPTLAVAPGSTFLQPGRDALGRHCSTYERSGVTGADDRRAAKSLAARPLARPV